VPKLSYLHYKLGIRVGQVADEARRGRRTEIRLVCLWSVTSALQRVTSKKKIPPNIVRMLSFFE